MYLLRRLHYKEPMVVARYEYILTTSLTFDDSILVKIEQEEEPTPDNIRIIKE